MTRICVIPECLFTCAKRHGLNCLLLTSFKKKILDSLNFVIVDSLMERSFMNVLIVIMARRTLVGMFSSVSYLLMPS